MARLCCCSVSGGELTTVPKYDEMLSYLDAASAAVTEMGGHVAKKLGDGLMALFGYPVAQENDAERAARAALSIQRALVELNRKNAGAGKPSLNARIGLLEARRFDVEIRDRRGGLHHDCYFVTRLFAISSSPYSQFEQLSGSSETSL
jgi:hypothetical protein